MLAVSNTCAGLTREGEEQLALAADMLNKAKRPIIFAGQGVIQVPPPSPRAPCSTGATFYAPLAARYWPASALSSPRCPLPCRILKCHAVRGTVEPCDPSIATRQSLSGVQHAEHATRKGAFHAKTSCTG